RALTSLLGKAGVANAKLAYARFKEIFHGPRFADLLARGAQVQRPLWASTGTKNPKYSDVLYVDNLVGPETVNTVPPQTYAAFLDHGQVALTLERDLDEARAVFDRLAGVGVDLKDVTEKLQTEGLKAFVNSFEALLASIEAKRGALMSGINEELRFSPGRYADAVSAALKEADKSDVMRRIWRKDPTVWKRQDESATTEEAEAVEKHHQNIRNSLGWLNVVGTMRAAEGELIEFAGSIRDAGFRHVMLCGMGGSSLAPEVLRRSFGPREGWPELLVLDSTDPDTLDEFARKIDVASCLFVIASKSGTTVEPSAFHKFWFAEVGKKKENAGENFVAVTDPGTHLEALAKEQNFRRVFTNPADIGGRYSALSYFGMVPAALMGLDVRRLLERAERVAQACGAVVPAADNPGARLGALVAACALDGRDKLTLVTDEKVASFGLWVEQLVAESTGKEGKGVIPVAGEPLGAPGVYGDDRLFVSVSVGQPASDVESALRALEAAGHPVVYRTLSDRFDIAEDFFLWEIATAFAGHRLGINPFDQPDVQKAKLATRDLLKAYDERGLLEDTRPTTSDGLLTLYADEQMRGLLDSASLVASVRAFLRQARGGDYFAFLSYVEETPAHDELIQALRVLLRDSTRRATTAGYGPRYLHSTGQLHKGGPPEGVFFLLTAPDAVDFEVPGERYSFTTLKNAQALGDFHTLTSSGRRAVRVDLGGDIAAGLRRLADVLRDVSVLQVAGAEGD
ncbi:MAG TPA: bifunctional transaldolase/phosoglucose isomerase, partial [Pyrinomonadaceae bacterium]|nr:bifunctional transaldolase/phosoglucose isomerase [Pyrinomonadaceae bacterium]